MGGNSFDFYSFLKITTFPGICIDFKALKLGEIWVEICWMYSWHNLQIDRCMGMFKPELLNKPGQAVLLSPTPFANSYKCPNSYLYMSEFFIFLLAAIRSIHKISRIIKAFKTSTAIYTWNDKNAEQPMSLWWAWGGKNCLEIYKFHICNSTVDYRGFMSKYFKMLCIYFLSYIFESQQFSLGKKDEIN